MYLQRSFLLRFEDQLNAAVHTNSSEDRFRFYKAISAVLENSTDIQATEAELFVDCIVKYIDLVSRCPVTTDENAQDIERYCSIISIIPDKLRSVRDMFAQAVAITVFEKLTDIQVPFIFAKELLINFNKLVQYSDKELLYKFIADNKFWLCKLIDILSVCGDYNHQTNIIKTIFDMCPSKEITAYSRTLFPESVQLQNAFCTIGQKHFDQNIIRGLLNIINAENVNVLSIKCDAVFLDDIQVVAPKSREEKVWVDFNVGSNTISIQSDPDSLKALPQHNDISNSSDDSCELIMVNGADVAKIFMTNWYVPELSSSKGVHIGVNLKKPSTATYASSWHAVEVHQLKLAVLYCPQLQRLKDNFLGKMFPEKLENLSLPVQKPNFQYLIRTSANLRPTSRSINVGTSQYEFHTPKYVGSANERNRLSLGIEAIRTKELDIKLKSRMMVTTHTPRIFTAVEEIVESVTNDPFKEFKSTTECSTSRLSDRVQGIKAIAKKELDIKPKSRMMATARIPGIFTTVEEIVEIDSDHSFEECNSNRLSNRVQVQPVSEHKLQSLLLTGKHDNQLQAQKNKENFNENDALKTAKLATKARKTDGKKAKRTTSLPTIPETTLNDLPRLRRSQKRIVCNAKPNDQNREKITEQESYFLKLELCRKQFTGHDERTVEGQQNQMETQVTKKRMSLGHRRLTAYDNHEQIVPEESEKQLQERICVKAKHQLDVAVPKKQSTPNRQRATKVFQKETNTQERQLRMHKGRLNLQGKTEKGPNQLQELVCEKLEHRLVVAEPEKQLSTHVEVRIEKQEKHLIIQELQDPVKMDQKQDNISNFQQTTKIEKSRNQLHSEEYQNTMAAQQPVDEASKKQRTTQEQEEPLVNRELEHPIKINQQEQNREHLQQQATDEGQNHLQDEVFQEMVEVEKHQLQEQEEQLVDHDLEDPIKINEKQQQNMVQLQQQAIEEEQNRLLDQVPQEMLEAEKHQLHAEKSEKQAPTHEQPTSEEGNRGFNSQEFLEPVDVDEKQCNVDELQQHTKTEERFIQFQDQVCQETVEDERHFQNRELSTEGHQIPLNSCLKISPIAKTPLVNLQKADIQKHFETEVSDTVDASTEVIDEINTNFTAVEVIPDKISKTDSKGKTRFNSKLSTKKNSKKQSHVKHQKPKDTDKIQMQSEIEQLTDKVEEPHKIIKTDKNHTKMFNTQELPTEPPIEIISDVRVEEQNLSNVIGQTCDNSPSTLNVPTIITRSTSKKIMEHTAVEVTPTKIDRKYLKHKKGVITKLSTEKNIKKPSQLNVKDQKQKDVHKIEIPLEMQSEIEHLTDKVEEPHKISDVPVEEQSLPNVIEQICDNSPSTVNVPTIITSPTGKKIIEEIDTENTAVEVTPVKIDKKHLKDKRRVSTKLSTKKSIRKSSQLNVNNQKQKDVHKIQMQSEIEHLTDKVEEPHKIIKADNSHKKILQMQEVPIEQPIEIISVPVEEQSLPNIIEKICDNSHSTVNIPTIITSSIGKKIIEEFDAKNTAIEVTPAKIDRKSIKRVITKLSTEKSIQEPSQENVNNQKQKDVDKIQIPLELQSQIEHQTNNVEEVITKIDKNPQTLVTPQELAIEQPTQIITDIPVEGPNMPNIIANISDDSSLSTKPQPCGLSRKQSTSENLDRENIKPAKVQKRTGRKLYNPNDLSYIETLDETKFNLDDSTKESIGEGSKRRKLNSTNEDSHNKSSMLNEITILEKSRRKLDGSFKQTKEKRVIKDSRKKLSTKSKREDPRVKLSTPHEITKNQKSISDYLSHMQILEETESKLDNPSKQSEKKPATTEPKKQLLKRDKQDNVHGDLRTNETYSEPKPKIAKDADSTFNNLLNRNNKTPVDKGPTIKSIIKKRNETLSNKVSQHEIIKNQTMIQSEVEVKFAELYEELSKRISSHREIPSKTKLSQSRRSTKAKSSYKSLTKSQKLNQVDGLLRQPITHDGYESLHTDKESTHTRTPYKRKIGNLTKKASTSRRSHKKSFKDDGLQSPLNRSRSNSVTLPELEKEKTLPVTQLEILTTDTDTPEIVQPKPKVKILSNILLAKGAPVKMNVMYDTCKPTEVVNLESQIFSQASTVLIPPDIYSQERQCNTQSTENIEKIKNFLNGGELLSYQHIPELDEPNVSDNVECVPKVLPTSSTKTAKKDSSLAAVGELKDVIAAIVRVQNTITKMLVQILGGSIQEDFAELFQLLVKFDQDFSNYFKQN